jgi:hypothetical protein
MFAHFCPSAIVTLGMTRTIVVFGKIAAHDEVSSLWQKRHDGLKRGANSAAGA